MSVSYRELIVKYQMSPLGGPSDRLVSPVVHQAAIGSKALDMAREEGDEALIRFGLDVLTLAVLAILTTAPVGALGIGLAGPRLLARRVKGQLTDSWRRRSPHCSSGLSATCLRDSLLSPADETEPEAPPTDQNGPGGKNHVIIESKV